MNTLSNGYAWFGFFGFTTNFLNKNILQILVKEVLKILVIANH
jgi:hypothetical protein